jgi:hypothetical protein
MRRAIWTVYQSLKSYLFRNANQENLFQEIVHTHGVDNLLEQIFLKGSQQESYCFNTYVTKSHVIYMYLHEVYDRLS